jgi:hypothetical protein
MNQPWPLKELNLLKDDTTVIFFLLSGFAFAYVIGYFLAFDLAWLPFFSLSEHIVFALRALPFAVAALVALLFAKDFPDLLGRAILVWICILWVAAVTALMTRYLGFSVHMLCSKFGRKNNLRGSGTGNPRVRIGRHESQWQMADQLSRREGSDCILHDGRR